MNPVISLDVVTSAAQCLPELKRKHIGDVKLTHHLELETKIGTIWDSREFKVLWPDMPHACKCPLLFKEWLSSGRLLPHKQVSTGPCLTFNFVPYVAF